jgi:DNA (cytosine-5)-methyltransferase 1
MKYLNVQAGLGGNIELIDDTVHEITNVEIEPSIADVLIRRKPRQKVIIGDANQYLLDHAEEFDFIWASPPCQTHSRMMKATRHKRKRFTDMTLYQYHIFLTHFFKGKWVIENVKPFYEPLIKPTAIIGRHYFWSNFPIDEDFEIDQPKGFITAGTVAETQKLKDWLGIQYEGNIYYKDNHCPGQVLRNCVHPQLGLYIFEQVQGIIRQEKTAQLKLL